MNSHASPELKVMTMTIVMIDKIACPKSCMTNRSHSHSHSHSHGFSHDYIMTEYHDCSAVDLYTNKEIFTN